MISHTMSGHNSVKSHAIQSVKEAPQGDDREGRLLLGEYVQRGNPYGMLKVLDEHPSFRHGSNMASRKGDNDPSAAAGASTSNHSPEAGFGGIAPTFFHLVCDNAAQRRTTFEPSLVLPSNISGIVSAHPFRRSLPERLRIKQATCVTEQLSTCRTGKTAYHFFRSGEMGHENPQAFTPRESSEGLLLQGPWGILGGSCKGGHRNENYIESWKNISYQESDADSVIECESGERGLRERGLRECGLHPDGGVEVTGLTLSLALTLTLSLALTVTLIGLHPDGGVEVAGVETKGSHSGSKAEALHRHWKRGQPHGR